MTLKDSLAVRKARRAIRWVSDETVQLTAPVRMQPDFLICGAQRGGTTSMFKTLIQHPDVARPFLRKGVHYFDVNYSRGMRWYRGHFPVTATSRAKRRGKSPITGESSPYYLFHPLAPARIARDLPGVKVLVLLRDPVERAYSGHSHELGKGFETLPFPEALEQEHERIAGERERMLADESYDSYNLQHYAHVTRGQYIDQIVEMERQVGTDNLLVVDSGDFFSEPEPVFEAVCAFLGLRHVDGIAFERHNARSRSAMDPQIRARLEEHYRQYDERLAEWWGHQPSWRR